MSPHSSSLASDTSAYNPYWEPPPVGISISSSSKSSFLTAGIVVVVVLLGIVFILVSYYRVFGRFCGWPRLWNSTDRRAASGHDTHFEFEPNFNRVAGGLEESLIKKIPAFSYKDTDGLIESTDCSICLNEFRSNDNLRLLPKCSHAFHVSCIDTWLKSHSNCPLCRAPIFSQTAVPDQTQNARLQELHVPQSVDRDERPVPSSSPIPSDYVDQVFCNNLQQFRMRTEENRIRTYRTMEAESLSGPLRLEDLTNYTFPNSRMGLLTRALSLPERKHGENRNRSHWMRRHSSTRRQPFPPLRRLNSTGSFRDGSQTTIMDGPQKKKKSTTEKIAAANAVFQEFGNTASTSSMTDGFTIIDMNSMASSSSCTHMIVSSPCSSESVPSNHGNSYSQEIKVSMLNIESHKATKPISFSHELRTKRKVEVDELITLRKSWSHTAAIRMKHSLSGRRLFQLVNSKRNWYEILRHPI